MITKIKTKNLWVKNFRPLFHLADVGSGGGVLGHAEPSGWKD